MLQNILDSLKSLVTEVAAKPLGAILTILLLFMAYFAVDMNNKIERLNHLAPTPVIEGERFQRALNVNEDIMSAMDNTREKLGAERLLVRQFHNGRADLTGIPFTSVAITYLSAKDGYGLGPNAFESRPISTMNKTLRDMWVDYKNPTCIVRNTVDIKDSELRQVLNDRGVVKVAYCPMTNMLNYPVGVISVNFSKTDGIPQDEQITKELNILAQKIVGSLNSIEQSKQSNSILNFFGW